MDSARWQRIQTLFHEAVEQPPEQQHTFLFSACPEDPALISEVLALLAEDARGDSMLDQSLASYASRMVGLEHASSASPTSWALPADKGTWAGWHGRSVASTAGRFL